MKKTKKKERGKKKEKRMNQITDQINDGTLYHLSLPFSSLSRPSGVSFLLQDLSFLEIHQKLSLLNSQPRFPPFFLPLSSLLPFSFSLFFSNTNSKKTKQKNFQLKQKRGHQKKKNFLLFLSLSLSFSHENSSSTRPILNCFLFSLELLHFCPFFPFEIFLATSFLLESNQ